MNRTMNDQKPKTVFVFSFVRVDEPEPRTRNGAVEMEMVKIIHDRTHHERDMTE